MWRRVAVADMSTRLVSHRRPRRRTQAANDRNRVRHRRRLPMMMSHLVAVPRLHLRPMTTRRVTMTIRVRTPIPILHRMMIHRPIRTIRPLLAMILQMIRTLLPLRHRRLMRIRVKRGTRRNPVIIKQVRINSN